MKSRRSSRGALTLPGRYYTSPEIYDREGTCIFSRRWLFAGSASTLREPGAYFLVDAEGESIIVLKDREGVFRAFYNVCRHRGTQLCEEAAGVFPRHIVCPYHAWAYDLAGALVSAPNMDAVERFDRRQFPLHAVATEVWEGLIFVNLAPDPEPFDEMFAPLARKFARWSLAELAPVHRAEYDIEANWKLFVQNYSECYHCPTLHPALNRLTPYRRASNDLEEGPILGGPMQLSPGVASMSMDGSACAAPLGNPSEEERRLVYYYVVFPSLCLSLMPDYAMTYRVLRRGPARTTLVCEWLFHPRAIETPGFDPSGAIEFWEMTNRQDWHICEQAQRGISSRAYRPGPYADLECMLVTLDREYLRAIGESKA